MHDGVAGDRQLQGGGCAGCAGGGGRSATGWRVCWRVPAERTGFGTLAVLGSRLQPALVSYSCQCAATAVLSNTELITTCINNNAFHTDLDHLLVGYGGIVLF